MQKKKPQCSTFKIVTCETFFNEYQNLQLKNQKLCIIEKKYSRNIFFTFYISVPNFGALEPIIYIFSKPIRSP